MSSNQTHAQLSADHGEVASAGVGAVGCFTRRAIIGLLLTLVLVPPAAGFYSYISGHPLHLLAPGQKIKEGSASAAPPSVSLVEDQPHTLKVPDEVCAALDIRKGERYATAVAAAPTGMRPLVLPGSTAFDPSRLARIRARFAPARVVELGQVRDNSGRFTEFRELRPGDNLIKGQLLGVFYSLDVGSKKNDLLDALVQLALDQKIFDRVELHREAVPEVFFLTQLRAVQGDRNAINRALNNLKLWDIPQDEIDALHAEARKISSDKDGWFKTPEGRGVKGEKQATDGTNDPAKEHENPWGRVTLRVPFDGVVVEKNVHIGEMVVDNTVNLFQIADVSRMLVIASCPEDALPTLESLSGGHGQWSVKTVGVASTDFPDGLPGTIDEIGYLIDPNQHTAVIKGYVENPGKHLRAGQYVSATVKIPPPDGVVEIPTDALVDDGRQSVIFVQPAADVPHFAMRRVDVTHRFEGTVFVRSTPFSEAARLTPRESEEGLLPKEPLLPGERVLLSGAVELKAALSDLESRRDEKARAGNSEPEKQ